MEPGPIGLDTAQKVARDLGLPETEIGTAFHARPLLLHEPKRLSAGPGRFQKSVERGDVSIANQYRNCPPRIFMPGGHSVCEYGLTKKFCYTFSEIAMQDHLLHWLRQDRGLRQCPPSTK